MLQGGIKKLKITKVEAHVLYSSYIIVRIETDVGIVGYGEASPMGASVVANTVRHLGRMLIDKDPFNIEALWMLMFTNGHKLGPMGTQLEAMAGIDIALYDIKGKALNTPIYNLLGGAYRLKVPVYASSMRRDMKPEEEAERVEMFYEQGYTWYKQHSAVPWGYDNQRDQTVEVVKAIRKRLGNKMTLLVDVNNAYTVHHALNIGRQLEELDVFHFEEPIPAYDYDGYNRLQATLDIPIAAGEQEYTRWQFRDLINIAQVDIIQPDVIKSGGFTEMMKIAALSQTFNKPITVHNTQPTIGTAAHLHFWAACQNCLYPQEYNIEPHPLRDKTPILKTPLALNKGYMDVPQGPGLGIEVDEKLLFELSER
ncbi:mandelate racemase/muconate lactonizing enzyme family protein [Candidatus Poribacteria bacterium]|nr:mandelate racemase/muconate lactonizing enzyme family protein [Candidatus Poribacteria bacterium]